MATSESFITIKGTKDGLLFLMDDKCSFDALVLSLKQKLRAEESRFFSGPITHVRVNLGFRPVTPEQERELRGLLKTHGNFIIDGIERRQAQAPRGDAAIETVIGTVRSGQELFFSTSVLLIGDVNPGGKLSAAGDVFVMGRLNGICCAGVGGDRQAVIVSPCLRPSQMRIAEVISRAPDEWETAPPHCEFAYLFEQEIRIDRINKLQQIRGGRDIRQFLK
jgi:septum site-determining protein MinC